MIKKINKKLDQCKHKTEGKTIILRLTTFLMIVLLMLFNNSKVEAINYEQEASTEIKGLLNNNHKLFLIEINFKNKEQDYLKFIVISDKNNTVNLKGLEFQDDKIFKTIENDFPVYPNQIITLYFNSTEKDDITNKKLFTDNKGITGTTEQILIKKDQTIYDFTCWVNNIPAKSELNDFTKFTITNVWKSNDIKSCFNSDLVKSNQSLIRKESNLNELIDTNEANDWMIKPEENSEEITDQAEILKANNQNEIINEQEPESIESLENTLDDSTQTANLEETFIDEKTEQKSENKKTTILKKNTNKPKIKTTKKQKKTDKTPAYKNGRKSEDILINEVMPNPTGDDRKNEWIELYNKGNEEVNLGNWSLDDEEGGSKPYTFSDQVIIKPKEYLVISSEKSKIALGNNEDQIRLFDYENEIINQIEYSEALENKTYAKINLTVDNLTDPNLTDKKNSDKEEIWEWTDDLTPGAANPEYQELQGKILSAPQFKEQYYFEFQNDQGTILQVIFEEKLIQGPLAKATFIAGNRMKIIGIMENSEDKNLKVLKLKKYETISILEQNSNSPYLNFSIIISVVIMISCGGYLAFKKLKKWKESIS